MPFLTNPVDTWVMRHGSDLNMCFPLREADSRGIDCAPREFSRFSLQVAWLLEPGFLFA